MFVALMRARVNARVTSANSTSWTSRATFASDAPRRARTTTTDERERRSNANDAREISTSMRARKIREELERDDELRREVFSQLSERGGVLDFDRADANGDGALDRREFLMALGRDEGKRVEAIGDGGVTYAQLRATALSAFVPFVGFGLCDNSIMILAGESIETSLGVGLGLSTMASAGLGNTVSDVIGIGLSSKIETVAARFGFAPPALTKEQSWSASVRRARLIGATSGVTVGCTLGMFPLLLGFQ